MAEHWAVILGASSGFGAATALELAKSGMHICGVHLDRKQAMPQVEQVIKQIESHGRKALYFNVNAADVEKRKEVLDGLEREMGPDRAKTSVKALFHSLAFGTLKPYVAEKPEDQLTQPQMEMTLDVMAHSLVYWTQELVHRKLMGHGSRVFAMTSSGGTRVWPTYGAVSAAKAALESHIRQLALELAPFGIAANAIRAGVTDTPALRKIPGNEQMIQFSIQRNPHHRLTTPQDVAACIASLCADATAWMTGNTIGVDGGEDIVG